MTTIYMIRHAEAEGNVYRRCHGHYDTLLTPKGHSQAALLADRFADISLDHIYASDLARTCLTAKPLADAKGLAIEKRPELREIFMGDWEDIPWGQLPLLYPEAFHCWEKAPWRCQIPNGETPIQVGQRLFDEIRTLGAENEGKTIAAFTHGAAIRAFITRAMGRSPEEMPLAGWCDNTAVAKLLYENGALTVEFKNDNSHLPQTLSTLSTQKWWKDDETLDSSLFNMWFRPVDVLKERDLVLHFAKMTYESAYGSADGLNEEDFIAKTLKMSQKNPEAVTFGMVKQEPMAFVRMDVLDTVEPDIGYVGTFCIEEKCRGAGFAPQILGQATHVYRDMGKDFIRARVAATNLRAQKFYLKNGFVQVGDWTNELGPHLVMEKNIRVKGII